MELSVSIQVTAQEGNYNWFMDTGMRAADKVFIQCKRHLQNVNVFL